MDTQALSVFVQAVATGSLSAAARRVGVMPVVASRRLASLERELGLRLLHRTTRSLSLTPEGEALLPYAQDILEREAAAIATIRPDGDGAVGLLRVTAPASLGHEIIMPMLPGLLARNPGLKIELHLTERLADVVAEGFDVAVRIADLRDSTLVARRLGRVRRVLCATPDYIARHGRPATIADLSRHECLALTGVTHWTFSTPAGKQRLRVTGRLSCSTIDGLRAACLQGLGISMQADWAVSADIRAGRHLPLPLDASPHAPTISALYPSARFVTPKLRVFLDALDDMLAAERNSPAESASRI